MAVKVAGRVITDLWWDWEPRVDLYNVNVPLGFRDEKGTPVEPDIRRTPIDRASYSSLYRETTAMFLWTPPL